MHCTEVNDLLDLYIDGALSEELCTRLDRHLLQCAQCAVEARGLEHARALLREACEPAAISPAFRERLGARLEDALSDALKPAASTVASASQWPLPYLRERG